MIGVNMSHDKQDLNEAVNPATAKLRALLTTMQEDGPTRRDAGICINLNVLSARPWMYDDALIASFRKWKYFSGSNAYPIPGEYYAYSDAELHATCWDENTIYGRLRLDLLQHLIDTVVVEDG